MDLPDTLVHDYTERMLGNIEDTSSFAMIDFVWHALMKGTIAFDGNNIASLIGPVECRQRLSTSLAKVTSKHVPCTTTIAFWIGHCSKLRPVTEIIRRRKDEKKGLFTMLSNAND